jgi:hypothetical protein
MTTSLRRRRRRNWLGTAAINVVSCALIVGAITIVFGFARVPHVPRIVALETNHSGPAGTATAPAGSEPARTTILDLPANFFANGTFSGSGGFAPGSSLLRILDGATGTGAGGSSTSSPSVTVPPSGSASKIAADRNSGNSGNTGTTTTTTTAIATGTTGTTGTTGNSGNTGNGTSGGQGGSSGPGPGSGPGNPGGPGDTGNPGNPGIGPGTPGVRTPPPRQPNLGPATGTTSSPEVPRPGSGVGPS